MPKRKRGQYGPPIDDDPAAQLAAKKQAVERKLFHGKIVVGRALKNAKTLLLLKLARKLKAGIEDAKESTRTEKEIEALKVCHSITANQELSTILTSCRDRISISNLQSTRISTRRFSSPKNGPNRGCFRRR